jgi:hypothetical protein
MMNPLLLLGSVILAPTLVSSAVAGLFYWLTRSIFASRIVGSLTIPVFLIFMLFYWLNNMEADDAAPGNVISGVFVAIAVLTPIAFVASHCTAKCLSRIIASPRKHKH